MKKSLFFLILSAMLLMRATADEPSSKAPAVIVPLLQPLKGDAIEIGEGPNDAYVFVDPKCLRSREFLDTITTNATLRKMFHYYIFLYDMPEVDSKEVINAIYGDAAPKEAMFTYMLKRRRIAKQSDEIPPAAQEKIRRIEAAAGQIGIKRTPYLIVDKQQ